MPTLSKEDYVEPVNPTPNNSQTAPKKSKAVTSATKGKVVYAISGKYAVVKKCTSKKAKSVTILNKDWQKDVYRYFDCEKCFQRLQEAEESNH